MLKLYSQLKSLPIMGLREGRRIGHIDDVIVDPSTGRIIAYSARSGGWLQGIQLINAPDLREVSSDLAIVDSSEVLTDPSEMIRAREVMGDKVRLVGSKVATENGDQLGRVSDYAIDIVFHELDRLNVSGGVLGRELIIPRAEIVTIERGRVVVKDQLLTEAAPSRPAVAG